MLTAEENELLTRIEGDAPMGQMMRHHWIPALMTEEVSEPDGTPVRVRLFGENLVAFRDTDGRVGIVDERCPHRLASLAFGRNEECGLRCLYHGWKFDVDGNVVEMPTESEGSNFAEKVKLKSYPTREAGGFIWAYMGPEEKMPRFMAPPWLVESDTSFAIAKINERTNWAQALEGSIDSAHSSALHSSNIMSGGGERTGPRDTLGGRSSGLMERPSYDKSPRIQVMPTPYGFRYAAIRKPSVNAEENNYIRITAYVAPFFSLIPPNTLYSAVQVFVPVDDYNTTFYFIARGNDSHVDTSWWRQRLCARPGIDVDEKWNKVRTLENNYLQDRQKMKLGDFTGISGIPNQDMAMQETMGPIADRTREKLGASDIAIVRFRQVMIDAARKFQETGDVIGLGEDRLQPNALRAYEGIVPKSQSWHELGMSDAEAELYRSSKTAEEESAA
ncbi:Rieske 2Fe-2S domain-containing protein [Hoeflea sp.]|uniref:Rieske 2Fe-2S domain-containing protein n=1 Tax=Hoeflea sp. TaxID=1940281 RepID=UPI003B0180A0